METPKATTWITIRVSPSQKARLLTMAAKAGDPNPSVTIIRKIFGREEAARRARFQKRSAETKRQRQLFPKGRKEAARSRLATARA